MTESIPPEVLRKIRKLAQLPDEARQSRFAVSVTRLTVLKSLCQQPKVANRFVTYLVRKVLERVEHGKDRASRPKAANLVHREMMSEALAGMEAWQQAPTDDLRQALSDLHLRMKMDQNEYKNIPYGSVRLIEDWNLFLCEQALACLLHPQEPGYWAYKMARDYAECYDSSHGTGLTPASAPLLQDIAEFWKREFDLTNQELTTPVRKEQEKETGPPAMRAIKSAAENRKKARFTHRQGQFLAFIHHYRRLHRQGPAETDMVKFFRVTTPAAHGMVVRLEELDLVARETGVARSIRVAIPEDEIPKLEETEGLPW